MNQDILIKLLDLFQNTYDFLLIFCKSSQMVRSRQYLQLITRLHIAFHIILHLLVKEKEMAVSLTVLHYLWFLYRFSHILPSRVPISSTYFPQNHRYRTIKTSLGSDKTVFGLKRQETRLAVLLPLIT